MPEHYSASEGRVYVHKSCGTATQVTGRHLVQVCNPFAPCIGTICAKCGPDSTKNFQWADTDESVSAFRRRVRRESPLLTVMHWLVAPIIGAIIGAMVMLMFKAPNVAFEVAAMIGGVAGALAMVIFIAPVLSGTVLSQYFVDRP